jgi:hypothetical protein
MENNNCNVKIADKSQLEKLKVKLPTATRVGRGGKVFEYIPARYVQDRITSVFGLQWNFEILNELIEKGYIAVKIRLHYPTEDGMKFKDAYGGAKYEESVGLGDGLKKSASLALKKAATLIGVDLQDEDSTPISTEQMTEIAKLLKELNLTVSDTMAEAIPNMSAPEAETVIEGLKSQLANK